MHSLRRTLAVRYSATMFVALVAIALWAWLGTRHLLERELDRGINAAAELELATLAAGRLPAAHATIPSIDAFVERLNRFAVVRDTTGAVMAANTPFALDLPADSAALANAARNRPAWSIATWHGRTIRSYYVPTPRGSPADAAVLQIAATRGPLDAVHRDVLIFMLGTVLLGTVATMFGAGWLARAAVQPVHEIAGQADAVAPGTAGQRITVHGDVEEFQRLIGVLNRMLERLDRALLAERRIIRDAGHDLRTPVTAIQGEVEVALRRERTAEEYQRILRSVLDEAVQLGALSESLITLARVEAGELEPVPARVDPADLAEEVAGRMRDDNPITVAGSGVSVLADPDLLSLALQHLVDNAVRHTPDGTAVRVNVHGNGAAAEIVVEDDGPGLSDEDRSHLFERLYRADSARGRGGAGLGLSIVQAIAHAHGGSVTAERAPSGGLRIRLRLPRG